MKEQDFPGDIQYQLLEADEPDWEELKAHPDFSAQWALLFLKRQKAIGKEALEAIAMDRDLIRHYRVVLALVKHRSFPQTLFMRFAETLRWSDILVCLRLTWVSISSKTALMSNLMQRFPFFTLGEKMAIARKAPKILITRLRTESEIKVIQVLLKNPNFGHADALFLASAPSSSSRVLQLLAYSPKWTCHKDVRLALLRNGCTPHACYRSLLEGFTKAELTNLKKDPRIPQFAKVLAGQLKGRT